LIENPKNEILLQSSRFSHVNPLNEWNEGNDYGNTGNGRRARNHSPCINSCPSSATLT